MQDYNLGIFLIFFSLLVDETSIICNKTPYFKDMKPHLSVFLHAI